MMKFSYPEKILSEEVGRIKQEIDFKTLQQKKCNPEQLKNLVEEIKVLKNECSQCEQILSMIKPKKRIPVKPQIKVHGNTKPIQYVGNGTINVIE